MATSLFLITHSKLTGKETHNDWARIVGDLNQLQLQTTSFVNVKNEIVKECGSWSYDIEIEEKRPFNVEFCGPFHIQLRLYSKVGVIYTIYNYSLLYEMYLLDWFESY